MPEDSSRLLTVLTRNAARNRRRRHDRAAPHLDAPLDALADGGPTADELLARLDDELKLRGCVARLGELQRKVVSLRMLDEVPGEDVAALLGLAPGHVAVLLHRAKASLRSCMERGG